jgi:hypothetical protein
MVAKKKGEYFDILVSPAWRPMLRVFGVKPETAFVEVTAHDLHVKFGRFEQTFPLADVESVKLAEWPLLAGIGPRYLPGTVGLVGTYVNTVMVRFATPQRFRFMFRFPFKRLYLSLKEPEAFIAALMKPAVETKAA